jgi:alkyl hydroperoxide reductase subunit AhpC
VLGVSVDSVHSHKAYASHLGGISFPLLADFHPHGEVTRRYGLWREDRGNGKRATFIIDTDGTVRWNIVYPTAPPDYEHLFEALEALKR